MASPISGTPVSLSDDQFSAALPIGFTFNFFGVDYTNFHISSNGFIGFTTGTSSGCCSGQSIPSASAPNNLIAFAWDDLDPGNGGQPTTNLVQYTTVGVAPNRKMVMEFYNVDHYSSGNNLTAQVHLYETTNIIEIHTITMPNDGSNHTQGIENVDGTIAFAVPGRNANGTWSLTNDYVAFIPDTCTTTQNIEVLAAPNVVASVDINSVCEGMGTQVTFTGSGADSTFIWNNGIMDGVAMTPTVTNTYTVTGYDSTGCYSMDSVTVTVNPNPTVVLSSTDELFGSDGTATVVASGNGAFTYDWNNDGIGDFDDLDSIGGLTSGTYTVTVMDVNGCMISDSVAVGSQLGIKNINEIEFSIYPNPSTGVFQINLDVNDVNNNLTYEVLNSIGQVVASDKISSSIVNINIKGNDAGVYFVRIISKNGSTVKSIVIE
jgi:hypothetical protein